MIDADLSNVVWLDKAQKKGSTKVYQETLVGCSTQEQMLANEAQFKKWVRDIWGGWLESYEPRRGSGVGIPDIQIAFDQRLWPIELKVGEIAEGRLYPHEVRPDQLGWHRRLADQGIVSVFLVGVYGPKALDYVFCISQEQIGDWRVGFDLDDIKMLRIHRAQFSRDLRSHLRILQALTPTLCVNRD